MDIISYRRAQTYAYSNLATWRYYQAHFPVTFRQVGFPITVESSMDLCPLLDTMQEGIWDLIISEMGGLSGSDIEYLVSSLVGFRKFLAGTFEIRDGRLPLDTMIAHLCLFRKIQRFNHHDILEIGPGCGYLSFYLANSAISTYSQIENTESFYLLQYLVNQFCFKDKNFERVHSTDLAINIGSCVHYPWWKISAVSNFSFDIITSNANLTEMSDAARAEYIHLIKGCLKENGVLVVQCYGYEGGISTRNNVINQLTDAGFEELEQKFIGRAAHNNGAWVRKGERPIVSYAEENVCRKSITKEHIIELVNNKFT